MTRPDTNTQTQAAWTYESVEYSDGYHHTVFNPQGKAVCDCNSEELAKNLVELKNKEPGQ